MQIRNPHLVSRLYRTVLAPDPPEVIPVDETTKPTDAEVKRVRDALAQHNAQKNGRNQP